MFLEVSVVVFITWWEATENARAVFKVWRLLFMQLNSLCNHFSKVNLDIDEVDLAWSNSWDWSWLMFLLSKRQFVNLFLVSFICKLSNSFYFYYFFINPTINNKHPLRAFSHCEWNPSSSPQFSLPWAFICYQSRGILHSSFNLLPIRFWYCCISYQHITLVLDHSGLDPWVDLVIAWEVHMCHINIPLKFDDG